MNRCAKIEYGRLSGEIGWTGVNSRVLSSKKPVLAAGYQHFSLGAEEMTRAPGSPQRRSNGRANIGRVCFGFPAADRLPIAPKPSRFARDHQGEHR